mmetsp:Transcript_47454/g.136436  ORF Transcript_47454/g.136436 Transcript_47454/m.136436 type:complete len:352 (-) Transcript_47454:736-1791(-)
MVAGCSRSGGCCCCCPSSTSRFQRGRCVDPMRHVSPPLGLEASGRHCCCCCPSSASALSTAMSASPSQALSASSAASDGAETVVKACPGVGLPAIQSSTKATTAANSSARALAWSRSAKRSRVCDQSCANSASTARRASAAACMASRAAANVASWASARSSAARSATSAAKWSASAADSALATSASISPTFRSMNSSKLRITTPSKALRLSGRRASDVGKAAARVCPPSSVTKAKRAEMASSRSFSELHVASNAVLKRPSRRYLATPKRLCKALAFTPACSTCLCAASTFAFAVATSRSTTLARAFAESKAALQATSADVDAAHFALCATSSSWVACTCAARAASARSAMA